MPANFKPLRSTHGFQSPGFLVSPTGKITITSGETQVFNDRVDINDSLYVSDQIYIDNVPLLDLSDPLVNKLNSAITESSLTRLDTLQELNVDGDVNIEDGSGNVNISIVSGMIEITSTTVGAIDNIDIGQSTPGNATFNIVDINSTLTVDGTVTLIAALNGPTGNITTVNSTTGNITTVNATTGNITTINATELTLDEITVDDITINNTPVELYHATRKDYVDNRITAFSIAFGA
jgi:hypothetical protein